MKRALVFALAGSLAWGVACGEKDPPAAPPEPTPETPAATPPSEPEVPVEADPTPAPKPAPSPAPRPSPSPNAPPPLPSPDPTPPPDPEPAPEPEREPEPAPEPAPPAISLDELADRIKETRAIGVFTKLALKNDIDDLLAELSAYHERGQGTLADLEERYEALVLKLLALLEKDEPDLALALARSRVEIWSRLADPVRFAEINT